VGPPSNSEASTGSENYGQTHETSADDRFVAGSSLRYCLQRRAADCRRLSNERTRTGPRARTKDVGRSRLVQIGLKPLALSADEAAALCGLSQAQFLKEVGAGNLPPPVRLLCKRKLWSLRALESAINGHVGTAADADPLMQEIKSRAARQVA
jgi:hypothetical protein